MYPGSIYARAPRRDNEVADELSLSSELVGNLNKLATPIKPSSIHTSELARLYMPNRVTFEDDAGDYVYEIKKYVSSLPDDSLKKNIQNRRAMNIKKKAMFRALVNCPDNPVVTLDTIKWADMFVEYSCNYQYKMFADAVGETATDTALKRVVAKLKEANGRPVSIRDLKQLPSMRKLKAPRQKDEIIKEVCECWGYEIIEATTGGRGKKSFYLAPNDD
jgi:hypothetical protein